MNNLFSRTYYRLIPAILLFVSFDAYCLDDIGLHYSTYITSSDTIVEVETDSSNNLYVLGRILGPNNGYATPAPEVPGGFGDPNKSGNKYFLLKFTEENSLVYSAFFNDGTVSALDIDDLGRVYLFGNRSDTTTPEYCSYNTGPFLLRLSSDGSSVEYCKNIVPNFGLHDEHDVAVDSSYNAYVIGSHAATPDKVPVSPDAYQQMSGGNWDTYILKISADGSTIINGTYLGGSDEEKGVGITLASDSTVIVIGNTRSTDFPGSSNSHHGETDAFFTRLSNDLKTLLHSEYIGGSAYDYSTSIEIDAADDVYVAGTTTSNDFYTTPTAFQAEHGGNNDGFIIKIDKFDVVQYSTYFGNHLFTSINAMAIGSSGDVYITGETAGLNDSYITENAFQQVQPPSFSQSFLSKLDIGTSTLGYSTYIAGTRDSTIGFIHAVSKSMTLTPSNEIIISGFTDTSDYPVTSDATNQYSGGQYTGFYSKFKTSLVTLNTPYVINDMHEDIPFNFALFATGGTEPYSWFIDERSLPTDISISKSGTINGKTAIFEGEKVEILRQYHEFDNPHFLPLRVGVKDSSGNIFHKEILAPYYFTYPIETPDDAEVTIGSSNGSGGSISIYLIIILLLSEYSSKLHKQLKGEK